MSCKFITWTLLFYKSILSTSTTYNILVIIDIRARTLTINMESWRALLSIEDEKLIKFYQIRTYLKVIYTLWDDNESKIIKERLWVAKFLFFFFVQKNQQVAWESNYFWLLRTPESNIRSCIQKLSNLPKTDLQKKYKSYCKPIWVKQRKVP